MTGSQPQQNLPTPKQNEWSTGLCSCSASPGGCCFFCYAYWCTCCAYGSVVELYQPNAVLCGGNCFAGSIAYMTIACLGCPCLLPLMSRNHLRSKYGLPGNSCQDFCVAWCCASCSLSQEYRELLIRGHGLGGVINGAAVPGMLDVAPRLQMMEAMAMQNIQQKVATMMPSLQPALAAPYPPVTPYPPAAPYPPAPYPPAVQPPAPYPPAPYPPAQAPAGQPPAPYPPAPYPPAQAPAGQPPAPYPSAPYPPAQAPAGQPPAPYPPAPYPPAPYPPAGQPPAPYLPTPYPPAQLPAGVYQQPAYGIPAAGDRQDPYKV